MKGIAIKCERGHQQFIAMPDSDLREATQLAGIMDGTSDVYMHKPREKPLVGSEIARCSVPLATGRCRAWFIAIAVGFDDAP